MKVWQIITVVAVASLPSMFVACAEGETDLFEPAGGSGGAGGQGGGGGEGGGTTGVGVTTGNTTAATTGGASVGGAGGMGTTSVGNTTATSSSGNTSSSTGGGTPCTNEFECLQVCIPGLPACVGGFCECTDLLDGGLPF